MPSLSVQKPSRALMLRAAQIFAAEFLGTAMLLFIGCNYKQRGFDNMWTFSMALITAIHIFGPISGAHVNPGATIVAYILGLIPRKPLVCVYWAAQILGGIFGYALHYEITLHGLEFNHKQSCLTKPFNDNASDINAQTFGLELITSFIFFMATAARLDKKNKFFGGSQAAKMGFVFLGLAESMAMSIPLSMNTVRSLPPAIFTADFSENWIYWIAPNVGAAIAGGVYRLAFDSRQDADDDEHKLS